jgi:hypothetical protein
MGTASASSKIPEHLTPQQKRTLRQRLHLTPESAAGRLFRYIFGRPLATAETEMQKVGPVLTILNGITDRLIPLFAVGAFGAFTMSQAGMVVQAAREACKSLTPLNFGIWVNRLRMYKNSLTMTECSFDK